jgi:hypothetical protein
MKKDILLIAMVFFTCASHAQSSDEAQVQEVINRLFKGMQLGDSAMVHSAFSREISMATAFRNKENNAILRKESSLDGFLKAVGTPHPEVWNEEIWNVKIHLDGDLAQAWCDYAFYVGNKFSHCGADAFLFHRGKEGWKIFHLADTRRTADCVIPNEISDKYKQK